MKNKILCLLTILILIVTFGYLNTVYAQEPTLTQDTQEVLEPQQSVFPEQVTLKGKILEIIDQGSDQLYGTTFSYQRYKVLITEGSKANQSVEILNTITQENEYPAYKVGDSVYIYYTKDSQGQESYYITDYVRINTMIIYSVVLILFLLLVIKLRGLSLLISWLFSLAIVLGFVLPKILEGENSAFITVMSAFIIAPVIYYLAHGFTRKTTIGLISSLISLLVVIVLTYTFINIAQISGLATEEALFFQAARGGFIDTKSLIISGVIVGSLGILNQLTFSQIDMVEKLKQENKKLDTTNMFHQAIENGRNNITSTINSLLFLYLGVTLPYLIMFVNNPLTHSEVFNSEMITVEITRVVVISLGLLISVPISTLMAIYYLEGKKVLFEKIKPKKN